MVSSAVGLTRRSDAQDWSLLSSSLLIGVFNYGYTFLVLHLVQPGEFAVFAFLSSLLLMVGTFAGAALPYLLGRQIANNARGSPERSRAVVFGVIASSASALAASALTAVLAAQLASAELLALAVISCAAVFAGSLVYGFLLGEHRLHLLALLNVLQVVVKVVAGGVFLLLAPTAEAAIAGFTVGSLLVAAVGLYLMRGSVRQPRAMLHGHGSMWREMLRLATLQTLVSIVHVLDVVVLAVLIGSSLDFAKYQAVLVLARVPTFLANALATAAFARLADRSLSAEAADATVTTSLRRYTVLAGLCLAGLATVPGPVLDLFLPEEYTDVRFLLLPLGLAGVAAGMFALVSFYVRAIERYRGMSWLLGSAIAPAVVLLLLAGGDLTWTAWITTVILGTLAGASLAIVHRLWPNARLPVVGLWVGCASAAVLYAASAWPAAWAVAAAALVVWAVWLLRRGIR